MHRRTPSLPGTTARGRRRLGAALAIAVGLAVAGPSRALAGSYVALGDSIAAGLGASPGLGYADLYRGLAGKDLKVALALVNLAVPGARSQDLLDALTTNASYQSAVAAADLVSFDIGGSDFLDALSTFSDGTCGGVDNQDCLRAVLVTVAANLSAIIAELRVLNATAVIRAMDYYYPFIAFLPPTTGPIILSYVDQFDAMIHTACEALGVPVARVHEAFNGPSGTEDPVPKGYISIDQLHPSPAGHAVIADAFRATGYDTPGVTTLVTTTALGLKDRSAPPADPSKRKVVFTASTKGGALASRVRPPGLGGADDPTVHGATLTVYASGGLSADRVTVGLPAPKWSAAGSGPFPRYRFHGVAGTDPIVSATVGRDKVAVKGGGASFGYTLDEPAQGRVAVRLRLGTGGGWCADAPAKTAGTPPSTAHSDHVDLFVGQKRTPAPATCPP